MAHLSSVPLGSHSPLTVAEDKATQLKVSQDKPMLVAVCHRTSHLSEKRNSLGLRDTVPAAHQAVQVPVGLCEKGVKELRAQQDVCGTGHVLVGGQPGIRCQHRLGLTGGVHLGTESGVSTRDLASQAGPAKGNELPASSVSCELRIQRALLSKSLIARYQPTLQSHRSGDPGATRPASSTFGTRTCASISALSCHPL